MDGMFYRTGFNGDLSSWDVRLFRLGRERAWSTNNNPSLLGVPSRLCFQLKWQVSSVTNMHAMFAHASSFDGDLSDWDVRLFRLGRERAGSMNNNPSLLGVLATLLSFGSPRS